MRGAAVAGVVLAVLAGSAHADTRVDVAMVTIDGTAAGDSQILVDGDDVWIPDSMLCARRICREGTRVHEQVRYVSLSAQYPDITYTFHRDAGELAISSAASARELTVIDLSVRAPQGLERTTSPSLFVNYAAHGDLDEGGLRGGGVFESGLSYGSAMLYTAFTANEDRSTRGMSYLSYDHQPSMTRFVAGDDVATSGALGSTSIIGGLHIKRDFALDPYFVARPTLSHEGLVTAPSVVEIYRGGQLIRRETLAPGPFRVEDVTGAAGMDAQVVVKDAFGSSRATVSTLIAPPLGLLKPGLSSFNYSVGVLRRNFATESFDYDTPALFATHRLGLTPRLTVGARAEASLDVGNVGVSMTTQRGRFVVEGGAAASNHGAAMSMHGTWQRTYLTFSAIGRLVTDRYATLDLDVTKDRATRELELSTTYSFNSKTTLLLSGAVARERDAGDRIRGGVGANISMFGSGSLLLAASTTQRETGTSAYEATATFVTSIGSNTSASVRAGYEAGSRMAAASVARSVPGQGGLGGQLDAQYGAVKAVTARGAALHRYGRLDATAMWTPSSLQGSLAVAGGLVVIGGRAFATPPVRGAYALVRAPSAGNARVFRENQFAGRLDDHGDLVVTDLQPFYANHLRLDARELPASVSLTDLERLVAPQRLGGTIIAFTSGTGAIVRGTIKLAGGGDASYGEITVGTLSGPLGHGGVFELEPVQGGTYAGTVALDGKTCRFTLVVPANVVEFNAGDVSCR